jgi:hypothetical protein
LAISWQLLGDSGNYLVISAGSLKLTGQNVSVTVNAGLTILYRKIGNRIRQDILKGKTGGVR